MEKPKIHQHYWYNDIDTSGSWQIEHKENLLDDTDKYNFACGNFYAAEAEAAADAFEMLLKLTLASAEEVSRMIVQREQK